MSNRSNRYPSSNQFFYQYYFADVITNPFTWFAWYPVKTQEGKWVFWKYVGCVQIQKKFMLDGPDFKFYAYSDKRIET